MLSGRLHQQCRVGHMSYFHSDKDDHDDHHHQYHVDDGGDGFRTNTTFNRLYDVLLTRTINLFDEVPRLPMKENT